MHRSSALIAPLAAVCLVAAGCGGSASQSDAQNGAQDEPTSYATDGTFTTTTIDDIGAFDPYHNLPARQYLRLAYDSLVNLLPDGTFVSGLAEEWSVDADSATFTLRPDVTCSDGTPLTAGHVAAAINYVSDPENQSVQYGQTVPTVPLTATGDDASRTVQVVLEEPFGLLLEMIGELPIVCAKGLEDPEMLATASDGTGPYVLSDVVAGQSYTFTRRDDYAWGPAGAATSEPGMPATVVVRVVENETTAANLLLSGELNLARVDGEDRQRLDAQGLDKIEIPKSATWLWFNEIGDRPTADKLVREALVKALDLDELVTVSTGGAGSAATGITAAEPKACPGDTIAGRLPEYDVAAAESLLDEAGWTRGADGTRSKDGAPLTLDMHFLADFAPLNKPAAELIAQRWESIGVSVNLAADTYTDWGRVFLETSNFTVYLLSWNVVLPTGMVRYLSGPVPPDGINAGGIDNQDYNDLTAKAVSMTPPEACTYWHEAEQALWREVNPVPVANDSFSFYLQGAEALAFKHPHYLVPTSFRVLD